jgi:carbon storage regulator
VLILSRRAGEAILLAGGIRVIVIATERGQVRLGIEAPPEVTILRQEIVDQVTAGTVAAVATPEALARLGFGPLQPARPVALAAARGRECRRRPERHAVRRGGDHRVTLGTEAEAEGARVAGRRIDRRQQLTPRLPRDVEDRRHRILVHRDRELAFVVPREEPCDLGRDRARIERHLALAVGEQGAEIGVHREEPVDHRAQVLGRAWQGRCAIMAQ